MRCDSGQSRHQVSAELVHQASVDHTLYLRTDLIKILACAHLQLNARSAEHVGDKSGLCAFRKLQLLVKTELDSHMSGIVILIADLSDKPHLETVESDRSRLRQSCHIRVGGVIVIGRFKNIDTLEVINSEEENQQRQQYTGTYDEFLGPYFFHESGLFDAFPVACLDDKCVRE